MFKDAEFLVGIFHLDGTTKAHIFEAFDQLLLFGGGPFTLIGIHLKLKRRLSVLCPSGLCSPSDIFMKFRVCGTTTPKLVDTFTEDTALDERTCCGIIEKPNSTIG